MFVKVKPHVPVAAEGHEECLFYPSVLTVFEHSQQPVREIPQDLELKDLHFEYQAPL